MGKPGFDVTKSGRNVHTIPVFENNLQLKIKFVEFVSQLNLSEFFILIKSSLLLGAATYLPDSEPTHAEHFQKPAIS